MCCESKLSTDNKLRINCDANIGIFANKYTRAIVSTLLCTYSFYTTKLIIFIV